MMKKMLCALMVIVMSALLIMPVAASEFAEPEVVEGNPACDDIICDWIGFKIEPGPWEGTHEIDGLGSITIEMVNETHFNFTATGVLINAVIVKGGDNAVLYNYHVYNDGPVSADTMLGPALNPANDQYFDISHIEFCYIVDGTPTPTPTPTPPPVPEFPISVPVVMSVFALAMGAVVLSLGKNH